MMMPDGGGDGDDDDDNGVDDNDDDNLFIKFVIIMFCQYLSGIYQEQIITERII